MVLSKVPKGTFEGKGRNLYMLIASACSQATVLVVKAKAATVPRVIFLNMIFVPLSYSAGVVSDLP